MKEKEFGPNQEQVDAIFVRLDAVDQGQALFLASMGADDPERREARQAMLRAARRWGREKALRAAQDEVKHWVDTWFTDVPLLPGYGRDVTPAEAAVHAAPVVLDAVGATVVRDLLPVEQVEALMGPWNELVAGTRD